MKNIIIFGTGEFGKNIYKKYKTEYNVLCFCDNDQKKQGSYLFDIKIINPENINEIDYDEIIIASSFCEEIYTQLISNLSLDKNKIIKLYVNESKTQFYSQEKRKKSEHFMLDIAKLLDKNNIRYYIDHGTLLGIVRDNCLIPWDKDIDFAVLIEDKAKIIDLIDNYLLTYVHPNCKKNKWNYKIAKNNIIVENKKKNLFVQMQIFNNYDIEEDDVALDLMFKYTKKSTIYWAICGKYLSVPLSVCFPTKQIMYKGYQLNTPNDVNKYLENLYGDWKTPVKEWTYDMYSNITN